MSRAEDNIIDLRLAASALLQATDNNSADVAALIEVSRHTLEASRRHSEETSAIREGMAAIQLAQLRTEAALQVFQQHADEAIARLTASEERLMAGDERLTASNERLEQLFEYLIRRDQGQSR